MITYKVVSRKNPINQSAMYYAQLVMGAPISIQQLAQRISESCTVNPADVSAVLIALETQLIHCLQEGKSVRFGNIGSFHVTLKSTGADLKTGVTASSINRVLCRFIPSTRLRRSLQPGINPDIKFVQAITPDTPPSSGGGGDGGSV